MEVNAGSSVTPDMSQGLSQLLPLPPDLCAEIAERLEDSSQIRNMIKALPEIEGAMDEKKCCWLFDEVLPHVSKWLSKKELLGCRQMCKQWCHAVDNFQQNHPVLKAYDHGNHAIGQLWITEDGHPTPRYESSVGHGKSCFFEQSETSAFLENVRSQPMMGRNPFVNREVHVHILSPHDREVLTGMSELILNLGQHIWFLSVMDERNAEPEPERFFNTLRSWMDHLPNVKRLFFRISWMADEHLAEDWGQPLPPLPDLETLHFGYRTLPTPFVQGCFASYSHQVRRLTFNIRYWKREFHGEFPNLTELTVGFPSEEAIPDLLFSLHAPLLYDIMLDSLAPNINLSWSVLLTSLRRFPLLRNLTLPAQTAVFGRSGAFIPELDTVDSVKFLSIGKLCLCDNAEFLLCFPNLECLYIAPSGRIDVEPQFQTTVDIWNPIIHLRLYESNVWELLRKLKGITVVMDENIVGEERVEERPYRFTRKTYEYRRRMAEAATSTST